MGNKNLHKARKKANDEFYTQLHDIENELRHYQDKFKGKVLYMNTDHPDKSNFWLHFKLLFNVYDLKLMISTFWSPEGDAFKTTYDGKDEVRTPLKGDGDFRSDECLSILKMSDVVVTNPPFSLFREFVRVLMEYNKEFLILGNSNASTYKEIFPLIKNNEIWYGITQSKMDFLVPKHSPANSKQWVDSEGNRYQSFGNIVWFTNIDYPKRYDDILLWTSYKGSEDYYPTFDNYNAINISSVREIPYDYKGVMGVPISFIGKWNPKQFEILGMAKTPICHDNHEDARRIKVYEDVIQVSSNGKKMTGNKVNDGPALKLDRVPDEGTYYIDGNGVILKAIYPRILIRNLNPIDDIKV